MDSDALHGTDCHVTANYLGSSTPPPRTTHTHAFPAGISRLLLAISLNQLPPPPLLHPQNGSVDPKNNVLKHAPHSADVVLADTWTRPYPRQQAAFPAAWVRQSKFWPTCSRVDNVYGDRHLITRLQDEELPEAVSA